MFMNRNKKPLIIVFTLIIIAFIFCMITYNYKKVNDAAPKSLMDYYFGDNEKKCIADLIYEDDQKAVIDDYTITLKEVIMEASVPTVYCKFAVTKDGQDMRKAQFENGYEFFGDISEGNRFQFFVDYEKNMGSSEFEFKATKEALYVYCEFALQPTENDITIYLYDSNSGKDEERLSENASGEFHINKKEKSKTYYYKDEEIVITPFRFVVRSETGLFCGKLEIFYKDKSSLLVRDGDDYQNVSHNTFGTAQENPYGSGYSNERYCDLEFKKPIDVENIDYICVSGNKLE